VRVRVEEEVKGQSKEERERDPPGLVDGGGRRTKANQDKAKGIERKREGGESK